MKEKPILFRAHEVRAILDGSKTQTRRIVKNATGLFWNHTGYRIVMRDGFTFWETHGGIPNEYGPAIPCPYGKPGDRLWVRETWQEVAWTPTGPRFVYNADGDASPDRWRPSIHMPRAVSRITLEVESVRVERLNDCSREDARAEGCRLPVTPGDTVFHVSRNEIVSQYAMLWESINGPGSWEANPWVWVITFKLITPTTP